MLLGMMPSCPAIGGDQRSAQAIADLLDQGLGLAEQHRWLLDLDGVFLFFRCHDSLSLDQFRRGHFQCKVSVSRLKAVLSF